MQFQYNSDYPDRFYNATPSSIDPTKLPPKLLPHNVDAKNPYDFPPVQPIVCARITTRIYYPNTQSIVTVPNVLVKTPQLPIIQQQQQQRRLSAHSFDMNQFNSNRGNRNSSEVDLDDDAMDSSSDSDFSSSDDEKSIDQVDAMLREEEDESEINETDFYNDPNHVAYWIQNTIREAIYGRVYKAVVLRKIHPKRKQQITQIQQQLLQQQQQQQIINVEWEVTAHHCAVKEMSWQHIRRERDRLAEDPVKEVCAMQFFQSWYNKNLYRQNLFIQQQPPQVITTTTTLQTQVSSITTTATNINPVSISSTTSSSIAIPTSNVTAAFQQMVDTNVMIPLDLLSDEKHLYSIMPYCNGGELFEILNLNDRFTEPEARYWMKQVLNGIECLQHAGICHRDMSLENLLVHNNGVLIIDMGMCLRIPYVPNETAATITAIDTTSNLSSSFNDMNIVNPTNKPLIASTVKTIDPDNVPDVPSVRNLRRFMMKPQGTCGKWHYMSPEIHNNNTPFDGYAVDMWAAGVILFLMLTGFPPWDRPSPTDERFKYMSAGYLVQMLTEWDIGLSPDAMDLLQRMMFLDPKDRLSLDQVRAHPWMVNGPCQPPNPITD